MKMRRISALKNLSECFDINEGGTAGFRSLRGWILRVHPLFTYWKMTCFLVNKHARLGKAE